MFQIDRLWARRQPSLVIQNGWLCPRIEAFADRLLRGIPWWVGLLMLVLLLVLPNVMASKLAKIWLQFPGVDKPAHLVTFIAVFLIAYGILRGRIWPESEGGKLSLGVVTSLGISLADEVQQAVLGLGRTAEYGDLVADAAGVFVGVTGVMARQLGVSRTLVFIALLLLPVAAVTAKTYQDLKHYNLGMMYERAHDYQRARAEYQLAVDSGFQSAEVYNAIAWLDIEFLNADPGKAEAYAARAFAMDPENPDILDTYGWVLVQAGRIREGLAHLEQANLKKPSMYCINVHLGVAYMKAGDQTRAVEHLKRQIEKSSVDRWGLSAKLTLSQLEGNAR